jgi:hypothetical protein
MEYVGIFKNSSLVFLVLDNFLNYKFLKNWTKATRETTNSNSPESIKVSS